MDCFDGEAEQLKYLVREDRVTERGAGGYNYKLRFNSDISDMGKGVHRGED